MLIFWFLFFARRIVANSVIMRIRVRIIDEGNSGTDDAMPVIVISWVL